MDRPRAVLLIHAGADPLTREEMTPERRVQYDETLQRSLRAGYETLQGPEGTSLDAVEAAIKVLEDSPLFNAGRGAAFNRDGRNELDASIIEGAQRRAGAVAGLTCIKNPIAAARAVMEKSGHVLMVGPGADRFASDLGLEVVDPSYYWTEERWEALQGQRRKEEGTPDGRAHRIGTVGAVALDRAGNLAAGASTGGTTNKRPGRAGDTPVIGAGTDAENGVCAVSCTGDGEYFIRLVVAHEIIALMKYKGLSARDAAAQVIHEALAEAGGEGGAIVLDAEGRWAMPFHSKGMYRGLLTDDGTTHVAIYEEWPGDD